ncbi:MAG: VOC family protein [Candidatus Gracilibacteria bacterium]|nr:VOC family protein [Candidatus Gracilibacteria bacterium]
MIGYITLGTNNLEKASEFYDKLLGEMGANRFLETDRFISWSFGPGLTRISIIKPFDNNPATVGNGNMVALHVKSKEEVDRLHKLVLELGGTNEGDSGPRGDNGFYTGYFRDLDGNKLSFFNI